MYHILLIVVVTTIFPRSSTAMMGKCNQQPPLATVDTPSENEGLFRFEIENAKRIQGDERIFYTPDQTYVLTITTTNSTRPFRWFMITAEDPAVDSILYDFGRKYVDVGSLKTLDTGAKSRYSERCPNTVENTDNSDKLHIEVHWLSPKQTSKHQQVRIRAMVAENNEVWYTGDSLTIVLNMDDKEPRDSPPLPNRETCSLCSEARYELVFQGQWSRVAHPRHYPSKPDENGYTHMIGASHGVNFTLWQQGAKASPGLHELVTMAEAEPIEREIIEAMTTEGGTRTLIRGKRRHHPYMSEPSHSLFRADRIHHMFSIVVGMRPSPDWFLGTTKFELCDEEKKEWLEEYEMPLYPWDAGTTDGVSYESPRSMTQPVDSVERVEIGSFNRESPFYQMNLNDLTPFAMLTVRRLDVYPLVGVDCGEESPPAQPENIETPQEDQVVMEEPVAEPRRSLPSDACAVTEWGEWSPCALDDGVCGAGLRTRTRLLRNKNIYSDKDKQDSYTAICQHANDLTTSENEYCFVNCY